MQDWRWFYKVRLRFRTVFRRNRVERELDEELCYHIEQRAKQECAGDSDGVCRAARAWGFGV